MWNSKGIDLHTQECGPLSPLLHEENLCVDYGLSDFLKSIFEMIKMGAGGGKQSGKAENAVRLKTSLWN